MQTRTDDHPPVAGNRAWCRQVYLWVLVGIVLGIIAPAVFCTVVAGIASMESVKKVGRTGGKAILYFEVRRASRWCVDCSL